MFLCSYSVHPPIINGDQMALHRNESISQRTVSLKSEITIVKEIVCFQRWLALLNFAVILSLSCSQGIKVNWTHLHPSAVVNYQWALKRSYHMEQIADLFKQLPNRFNTFNKKGFANNGWICSAFDAKNSTRNV